MPRFHCPLPLTVDAELALPAGAARHVQVLRLQPGASITLFNGEGGEFDAVVTHMGRSEVRVRIAGHQTVEREAARAVHLVVGMPANERMDWLVEKAAELGVASIQPVVTAHSVVRLSGERAAKKREHWQGVVIAACEQCGRNRVPAVHAPTDLAGWLAQQPSPGARLLLSLRGATGTPREAAGQDLLAPVTLLNGPEGGLSPQEEALARAAGFVPVTLGPRVLRAETAPLAALMQLL